MGALEIVVMGLALSADAFSVTITNSFVYAGERRRRLLLMPLFFGVFQTVMPLLGYTLGDVLSDIIDAYAGIVSLAILGIVGGNMIKEGVQHLRSDEGEGRDDDARLTVSGLFFQAIATSIDAFAVGVSLRAQAVNLFFATASFGVTTALCCLVAIVLGRRLGPLLGDRAEVVGGLVLVVIGVRAFLA